MGGLFLLLGRHGGEGERAACGGQATIPMVAAVSRVAKVHYAEIVASIASQSAGPGTRANIDEFTETTSQAIEKVGGAGKGKAIIVLTPAEPPLMMRDTVYVLSEMASQEAIAASIAEMAAAVHSSAELWTQSAFWQAPTKVSDLPRPPLTVSGMKVVQEVE